MRVRRVVRADVVMQMHRALRAAVLFLIGAVIGQILHVLHQELHIAVYPSHRSVLDYMCSSMKCVMCDKYSVVQGQLRIDSKFLKESMINFQNQKIH